MDTLFLILRVTLSLAAVLAVIWFIQRRVSRGSGRVRTQKAITVVGRQSVSAKASVAVVEIDGMRFVLGVTDHAVNVLHTATRPTVESTSEAFSRVLAEADAPLTTGTLTTAALTADALVTEPMRSEPAVIAPRADLAASLVAPRGPLAGSILSADTWKRAFASLKS